MRDFAAVNRFVIMNRYDFYVLLIVMEDVEENSLNAFVILFKVEFSIEIVFLYSETIFWGVSLQSNWNREQNIRNRSNVHFPLSCTLIFCL